jgi:hypothetical protein
MRMGERSRNRRRLFFRCIHAYMHTCHTCIHAIHTDLTVAVKAAVEFAAVCREGRGLRLSSRRLRKSISADDQQKNGRKKTKTEEEEDHDSAIERR